MNPDRTLIEKKASGHSLIQELRKAGISVWPVNPGTKDKVFRAHMVSQILKEGRLHYIPRNWAYEVINQCATFPVGEHDDLVDCVVMLLAYIRRMGIIELSDDEKDDEMKLFAQPRKFYGA
jgi:predicted phage terminase large subunit-like protein